MAEAYVFLADGFEEVEATVSPPLISCAVQEWK